MSQFVVTEESLTSIADAIRSKTGSADPLAFPDDFVDGISGIPTLERTEYTYSVPSRETSVDSGQLVLLGQIMMKNRADKILDVFPVSGYDATDFQYCFTLQSSAGSGSGERIYAVNFMLYNKSNHGAVFPKDAMQVKVIGYK